MKSTISLNTGAITFMHSEETCSLDTGEMCQFEQSKHFGTEHKCTLFGTTLFRHGFGPFEGFIARCHQCIDEFGPK